MSEDVTLDDFGQEIEDTDTTEQVLNYVSYPPEWSVVPFEELIEDIRYGTDTKSYTDGDGYPTLRIPNVVERKISIDDLKYTSIDKKKFDKLKLERGDIVLVRTNGNPSYVGRCAVFDGELDDAVFASYLIRVRAESGSANPIFISEFLNSHLGRKEMDGWISTSAGNHNLGISSIESFILPVPPHPEQRKIASVLYTIDQSIQKTKGIINQHERVKKGLHQDVFERGIDTNGELRPIPSEEPSKYEEKHGKNIPRDWDIESLAEIGDWVSGKTPKRSEPSYWEGTIPWITAKDMKTLFVKESEDRITRKAVEDGAPVVPDKSVLVLVRGMILDHTLPVVRPRGETSFNQDVKAILPHDSINPDYLAYWLKAHSNEVLALVTSASHGTKRLATDTFGNLDVPLPPLEEQSAIVEQLKSIDDLILREKSCIDRLERFKKGLKQDLLTGEVRTNDTDIEIPEEVSAYG